MQVSANVIGTGDVRSRIRLYNHFREQPKLRALQWYGFSAMPPCIRECVSSWHAASILARPCACAVSRSWQRILLLASPHSLTQHYLWCRTTDMECVSEVYSNTRTFMACCNRFYMNTSWSFFNMDGTRPGGRDCHCTEWKGHSHKKDRSQVKCVYRGPPSGAPLLRSYSTQLGSRWVFASILYSIPHFQHAANLFKGTNRRRHGRHTQTTS